MTPPLFSTPRLRVFRFDVEPTPHNTPRALFVAFRTDEDRPMPCATLLLNRTPFMDYVDWLEVTSEYRRMGFATELLGGVIDHLGVELTISGGSADGDAFCEKMEA